MTDALSRVESALNAAGMYQRSGNWTCPAHEDREPSLHLTSNPQGVGMKCHAGCDTKDIVAALDLKMDDLFEEPLKEVARYVYRSNGRMFEKVRLAAPGRKSFRWEPSLNGHKPDLYRLNEALALPDPVYVIESEQDVNTLLDKGVAATCMPGGAGTWLPRYTEALAGRDLVIVADRDDAGVNHALKVAADLTGSATTRLMQSKTVGDHDDIGDHLANGFTLSELVPLRPENEISKRYRRVNWHEAFRVQVDEVDWLLPPVLEAATINALYGKPGVGKSLLVLDWVVSLVREGKQVVYIDDENRVQDVVERLRAFGCTASELDCLSYYCFASLPALDTPEGGQHLSALAGVNEASLIILDTVSRMVQGDENDSTTYLSLYRHSLAPLKQQNRAVLRLDHAGKDESRGQRGSSSKAGDCDTIWRLALQQGGDLVLVREKSRSGHGEPVITYKRRDLPLRHDVTALGDLDVLPQVRAFAKWFDGQDIPRDVGRPALRDVLKASRGAPHQPDGGEISTAMLALVAKYRKSQDNTWTASGAIEDNLSLLSTKVMALR